MAEEEEGSKQTTGLHDTKLYSRVADTQWPIVYGPEYNIGFLGLERLHPFDAGKWGKIYGFLKESKMIRDETTVRPVEASEQDLLVVHTKEYLNSLKWSMKVAEITEVPPVACLPNFIVQRKVLRPFRYHTGGTIQAARLAVERGWAINLGGGFHHCSAQKGGGFCAYADITLSIQFLLQSNPAITKAMIIDLDAHQGNGHERDFMENENVYIMDVYNRGIYPHDGFAKRAIKRKVELAHFTGDDIYLRLVKENFRVALEEFTPDFLVYNAGTDILVGDPLGNLSISPQGIIERDKIVFEMAKSRNIPVMMVTSGGYQRSNARIIADSILNLRDLKLIECEEAERFPFKEEPTTSIPRSQSEFGLFTRIKNACMGRTSPQSSTPSLTVDNNMSKSISDLHKDIDKEFFFKETSSSKSCSDLTFKDESDIDISAVLDVRFGKLGDKSVKQESQTNCGSEQFHDECKVSSDQFQDECKVSSDQFHDECKVSSEEFHDECKVSSEQFHDESKVSSEEFQKVPQDKSQEQATVNNKDLTLTY